VPENSIDTRSHAQHCEHHRRQRGREDDLARTGGAAQVTGGIALPGLERSETHPPTHTNTHTHKFLKVPSADDALSSPELALAE
jgi:hypothetical protein